MRRLAIAVLAVGVLCALGGGAAQPAAGAFCAISSEALGNKPMRPNGPSGACSGTAGVAQAFISVQDRGTWVATGISCARVSEAGKGNYNNAVCDGVPGAQNCCEYIRVNVYEPWFWYFRVESLDAGKLPAGIQITKLTSAKATLKTKIAGVEAKFTTSTAPELVGAKLEGEGKLTTGGQLKFKEITTELNGKASAPCTPLGTAGKDTTLGTFTSSKIKGALVSHENDGAIQVLPETGTTFGKLSFGEECALPEEVPLITKKEGKGLVLKDPVGIASELKEHEITELPALTELWAISETTEHKATLEGSAAAALTGEHSGLKWSGVPKEFEVS